MRITFIYILFLCLLFSCKKENRFDCFKNTGKIIKEERIIGDFTNIMLEDNINLIIKPDTINKITIEAGEKIISLIKTEIRNNYCYITNENKCNWVRRYDVPINAYVSIRKLDTLNYWGSGNISCTDTIRNELFQIDVHDGSGNIDLTVATNETRIKIHTGPPTLSIKGKTIISFIFQFGTGIIRAEDLKSEFTFVRNFGTNDTYISVSKELEAKINDIGNIYYKGNPYSIKSEFTSTGKLFKL
jgi:hypothetical protein